MKDPHVYTPPKIHATRFKLKLTRKQIFLIVMVLAAAALITAGTILIVSRQRVNHDADKIKTALSQASAAMGKGNYTLAMDTLKPVENLSASKSDKLQIYSMLAASAMSRGLTDTTLQYYDKKHQVDPSTTGADAMLLAGYYQRIGQKDKAIEQYKLALTYLQSLPSSNIQRNMDISAVKARLEELGAKQ